MLMNSIRVVVSSFNLLALLVTAFPYAGDYGNYIFLDIIFNPINLNNSCIFTNEFPDKSREAANRRLLLCMMNSQPIIGH